MQKKTFIFLLVGLLTVFTHLGLKGISSVIPEKDERFLSVIVIDPGHGGKDTGASVGKAREKDIVLDIALKLGNFIKTNFPEIKIIYTRSTDIFIPLHERANIANKNKADLFISIHANAVENISVQGTETFVLGQHRVEDNLDIAKKENSVILLEDDYSTTYEDFDPNSDESYIMFELVQSEYLEQSIMFASDIQDQFQEVAKRKDRSVKQAGFLVLRRTTMPGILIEAGFLSNTNERNYLLSETGKTNIATAIFKAFKAYKSSIEEKSSFSINVKLPDQNIDPQKNESTKESQTLIATKSENQRTKFYSVQIAALKKEIDIKPSNFKGETNIFIKKSEKIYRYFSGKFETQEEAIIEKNRILLKFESAFVVAFEGDNLISVKKADWKM